MRGQARSTVGLGVLAAAMLALPAAAPGSAHIPMGPSARDCATAWSGASSPAQRARVAASRPLRAWIIPTTTPSCVIHFLLPGKRVLTATSPWPDSGGMRWQVTLRRRSSFSTSNARIASHAELLALGAQAGVRSPLRPSPTVATCLAAWNGRALVARRAFAGTTARAVTLIAERAPAGAIAVDGVIASAGAASAPSLSFGPQACVLTVPLTPTRLERVSGSWYFGTVTAWRTRTETATSAARAPNARLLPDGVLQLGR